MKKTLLSLSVALAIMLPHMASAKGYQSIVVTKTDATVLAIQGEQNLRATAKDQVLRFETPDESYIEIPLDEVTGWEYSEQAGDAQWTSISGVEMSSDVVITRTASGINLQNLPDNSVVTLTDIKGITLKSVKASGSCNIEFNGLQSGMYMLSFNNQTIKIYLTR